MNITLHMTEYVIYDRINIFINLYFLLLLNLSHTDVYMYMLY